MSFLNLLFPRALTVIALVAVLSGCALTPQAIQTEGTGACETKPAAEEACAVPPQPNDHSFHQYDRPRF